jgi:hypothetical protein
VRSESRCALRLRYVDLVVSIEVVVEVCCFFTYSIVKLRLKCNTGKVFNCLIQFLLTMFLSMEERVFRVKYVFREGNIYSDLDFYLWRAAKSAVYCDRSRTVNELKLQ